MKKVSIKLLSLALVFVLFFSFILTSCIFEPDVEYLESGEDLLAVAKAEEDRDERYVISYLKKWNFLPVNRSKFQGIEIVFRDYYAHSQTLPDAYTLTISTIELFVEYFYENINLENETEVTDALIHCYVESIGDPYSIYRDAASYEDYDTEMSGEFVGIGVTVEYNTIENEIRVVDVIEESGAYDSGIKIGDLIIDVDGINIKDATYTEIVNKIHGEEGTRVAVTVLRGEEEITFNPERRHIVVKTVRYSIGEDKIAYVRISSFKENTGKQFIEAIDAIEKAGAVGVIFDLRNNGGGYLSAVAEMLSYIAPKGTELVSFSNNYSRPIYATHSHTFTLPSVVICNGYTASAAELFTSAMRDFSDMGFFDVLVVGETTYGKGVMQSSYPFTDGSVITVTVAYYYPPCRIGYDGEGISPKAENTVTDDESTETDEQREHANSVIKELIGAKEEK